MKRVVIPELLDNDQGTPEEIEGSLADLRLINRSFGGVRTMTCLLRSVAKAKKLETISWLDVAGASGDVALHSQQTLEKEGIASNPILLDLNVTHMNRQLPAVCGDALALPFADDSFDAVGCSLFAHHLEPDQVTGFAREALRVARYAVLINDLIRTPLHLALIYAGFPLYRSRLTRHDAPASVKRAYTLDEMNEMLREAGAAQVETENYFLMRMGVIAWKQKKKHLSTNTI
jgi:ubiquinone/menaquinone biosynthesis C-methylase UbiE